MIINGENGAFKFEQIYDLRRMGSTNSRIKNKDSNNEMLTKVATDGTNEEFLKYLDSNFKSEINLSHSVTDQIKFWFPSDVSKSSDLCLEEINLTYRGHKHMFVKGVNAERRDVLYKNFIRALRRYLWTMFDRDFDFSQNATSKTSAEFKQNVKIFYEKYFRPFANEEITSNDVIEEEVCFIISTILSKKYSFKYKSDKRQRFRSQFEKLNKAFSIDDYERFFFKNYVSDVFEMFVKSGVVDKMIEAYPKLSDSRDSYLRIAQSIVEFKTTKTLIK